MSKVDLAFEEYEKEYFGINPKEKELAMAGI